MTIKRRVPLSLRTTPDVRAALDNAAKASGRSLTQEIEFRLEASLRGDDIRQIVREEIAAARDGGSLLSPNALSGMKGAITTTYPLPADGPVQVHVKGRGDRDWLRV